MSEEKTLGQIAFEATKSWMTWDHQNTNRELWEVTAQAVIAEHLRRNGEPVAWRWKENGAVNWIYDPDTEWRLSQGNGIKAEPLYAAPQPLPSLDEIDTAIRNAYVLNPDSIENMVDAVLELLKGKK